MSDPRPRSLRVYRFAVQEGFEWVLPVDDNDHQVLRDLGGTRVAGTWSPIRVTLLEEDERGRKRQLSDFPWVNAAVPVLRRKPMESLAELLKDQVEWLPLACDSTELYVMNVLAIVDGLDRPRSDLVTFTNSDEIMRVRSYAFKSAAIRGHDAFKVPELSRQSAFVNDRVVDLVSASGFRGVGFKLLWTDDG